MELETSLGVLEIEDVGLEKDGWVTISSQSVTFDKKDYYINEFNKNFPNYKLLGSDDSERFNFLTELCARNEAMRTWFAAVSIKYSDTTQLPLYLKDAVTPSEYKIIQGKLLLLKDRVAEFVDRRNELSVQYNADLKELRAKEKDVVGKTIGDDNLMKIVSLTTESLPLSIQMKIQSYSSESDNLDIADNRRRIAQEYLAKFKTSLIKMNAESEIEDVDVLLNEIALK